MRETERDTEVDSDKMHDATLSQIISIKQEDKQ